MWEAIGNETFMAAAFLPCQHLSGSKDSISGNQIEVVIKHPN